MTECRCYVVFLITHVHTIKKNLFFHKKKWLFCENSENKCQKKFYQSVNQAFQGRREKFVEFISYIFFFCCFLKIRHLTLSYFVGKLRLQFPSQVTICSFPGISCAYTFDTKGVTSYYFHPPCFTVRVPAILMYLWDINYG